MKAGGDPRSPRLARWFLRRTLPADRAADILGDLEEEYGRVVRSRERRAARRWYVREALALGIPFVGERIRARLGAIRGGGGRRGGESVSRGTIDGSRWAMGGLWRDVRFAVRRLVRAPGFTVVVLLTLGLGIGGSTAIFSVVDGIMLRPLPYAEPDRLVMVWADLTARGGPLREWLSYPNFRDLRQEADDVFEELAYFRSWSPTLTGHGDPALLSGGAMSHGMFGGVLGAEPALGRGFAAEDDRPGAEPVVMLSHGLWSRVFGGDPSIVGRTIQLDERPWTVIGVMPPGFTPPFVPDAELWRMARSTLGDFRDVRAAAIVRAIGRLERDIGLETARRRLDAVADRLESAYPEANTGVGFAVFPLHDEIVAPARAALWILLGAVGLVLVMACVNVANLLLARATARRSELAVRAALGAGRGRLVRQLLTESAVLAVAGGAAGIVLGVLGTGLLTALAPAGTPRIDAVAVDGRVLGFAAVVTLMSALLFGLLPALRAARADLRSDLTEGGRGSDPGAGGRALRGALVAAQVALALVLLVGSGLLIRSFGELSAVDLGFEPENRLALGVTLPTTRYDEPERRMDFFADLERRLEALPGVTDVGSTDTPPLGNLNGDTDFEVEGRPPPEPGQEPAAWVRVVTPDYLDVMGIRIVEGRAFAASDVRGEPSVIIINEAMARRYFPDRSAVGRRINFNAPPDRNWREIVGVAENIKNFGIREDSRNAVYFPYAQVRRTNMTVMVRTATDPASLIPAVRRELTALDPRLAATELRPVTDYVRATLAQDRFTTILLGLFAATALVLAVVGLYGIVSYGVGRRSRELGVRIALGAGSRDISRMVVRGGLALTAVGLLPGVVGAVALTRLMEGLLFDVSPTDPLTYAGVGLILLIVAAAASWIPARRAARTDPVRVLNSE